MVVRGERGEVAGEVLNREDGVSSHYSSNATEGIGFILFFLYLMKYKFCRQNHRDVLQTLHITSNIGTIGSHKKHTKQDQRSNPWPNGLYFDLCGFSLSFFYLFVPIWTKAGQGMICRRGQGLCHRRCQALSGI